MKVASDSIIALKVIACILLMLAFVVACVATSVWAGVSCFIDTANPYIGFVIGIVVFIMGMSARDWLVTFLYSTVFTTEELIKIAKSDFEGDER